MLSNDRCGRCENAGFTAGSELFDPVLLPLTLRLDEEKFVAWRIHHHYTGDVLPVKVYLVEIEVAFADGHMTFESIPDENPERAVDSAIFEARDFTCA